MTLMRYVVALVTVSAACGGGLNRADVCANGHYQSSSAACWDLATSARDDNERNRLQLESARKGMWTCDDPSQSAACEQATNTLWESPDPADVVALVQTSQQRCATKHDATSCMIASRAAWLGRGTRPNAIASVAWHGHGEVANSWYPSLGSLSADELIMRVQELVSAGAVDSASALVRRLPKNVTLAEGLVESLAEARWQRHVAPLLGHDDFDALAAADAVIALGGSPSQIARRDDLRARLVATEMDRSRAAAVQGASFAARFHAAVARSLGGNDPMPAVDMASLTSGLPTHPSFEVSAGCDWLRLKLTQVHAPDAGGGRAKILVTCTAVDEHHSGDETYTWIETKTETRTRTVGGGGFTMECTGPTQRETHDYITKGTGGASVLGPQSCTKVETPGQIETYTATIEVPHTDTHFVERRHLALEITGTIELAGIRQPVAFARDLNEEQFQDPHGSKSFSLETPDSLESSAARALADQLDSIVNELKMQRGRELTARANKSASPIEREDLLIRALLLGVGDGSFATAYRIQKSDVAQLLEKGTAKQRSVTLAFTDPPLPLPPVETGSDAATRFPQPRGPRTAEEQEMLNGPVKRGASGALGRKLFDGTALALTAGTRKDSLGARTAPVGLQLEHGYRLRGTLSPLYALALGSDGPSWDLQLGGAIGTRGLGIQVLGFGGFELEHMYAPSDPSTGMRASTTEAGAFFGASALLGLAHGLSAEARYTLLLGGALDGESRAGGTLIWRRRDGSELGLGAQHRTYDRGYVDELLLGYRFSLRR